MGITKVVRWSNAPTDAHNLIAARIEQVCEAELGRDIQVTPYNVEFRSHRIYGLLPGGTHGQPIPTAEHQTPTRVLTCICSPLDTKVLIIDHEMMARPNVVRDESMDGQERKVEDLPFKAEELSAAVEVVPHLVASSSPFLRQARTQTDENGDGFRNVANMTAASLHQPGLKRSALKETGPQPIPATTQQVMTLQYNVKLGGPRSAPEWVVKVYMLGGLVRAPTGGGAAPTNVFHGAIVEVEYCPFKSSSPTSPILDAFFSSLFSGIPPTTNPASGVSESPALKDVSVNPADFARIFKGEDEKRMDEQRRISLWSLFKTMRDENII